MVKGYKSKHTILIALAGRPAVFEQGRKPMQENGLSDEATKEA
jgi:hypothetical protein